MAEQSKTVDTALTLLRWSPTGRGPRRPRSPAASGMSRSAVGRMLVTLESHGLARRTAARLGGRARPAGAGRRRRARAPGAGPHRARGASPSRFGETAVLTVRDGDEAVAVDQVVGRRRRPAGPLPHRHPPPARPWPPAAGRCSTPARASTRVRGRARARGPGRRRRRARHRRAEPIASLAVVAPAHRFPPDDEVAAAAAGRRPAHRRRPGRQRPGAGRAATTTRRTPCRTTDGSVRCRPSGTPSSAPPTGASTPRS